VLLSPDATLWDSRRPRANNRLRHQETLGANATLTVVEVARRHAELHGLRKIGVLQNDEWIGTTEFQHRALIQWLRKTAPTSKRICSVCVGSFLLAAAGILNGHRAATHWLHAQLLASRHRDVIVEPDAIYVHDRKVWSSAGSTSGIDLPLALIEQDVGREVAIKVARILEGYLKRAGGQSQYGALLDGQAHSKPDPFNELEQWIAEHLRSNLCVEALADRVHMSPRNFARVYVQTRGRTPAKAVAAIRLDTARRRLEETTARIETIAGDCGFSGEEQMRLAFVRGLGIPPREYRKRFASAS
jgi:transcriptional regulator GlxA family with amidase domain